MNVESRDILATNSKPKRRKVANACISCRKAHVQCDTNRPCTRCLKRSIECIDAPAIKLCNNSYTKFNSNSELLQVTLPEGEMDFFQLFFDRKPSVMDDSSSIFNSLSLQPEMRGSNANIALPNCFAKLDDPLLLDLEEHAISSNGNYNVCMSRGLMGCEDCTFNVDNILPQPQVVHHSSIEYQNMIGHSFEVKDNHCIENRLFTENSSPNISKKAAITKSSHSIAHLDTVFARLGVEISIASHIIYLIKKLLLSNIYSSPQLTLSSYSDAMNKGFQATPTCIFSPSGLLSLSNKAFERMTTIPQAELQGFCIYSLLDMNGCLCILDMCRRCETTQIPGFGRCYFTPVQSILSQRIQCSFSISIFSESGCNWILGQFIPS